MKHLVQIVFLTTFFIPFLCKAQDTTANSSLNSSEIKVTSEDIISISPYQFRISSQQFMDGKNLAVELSKSNLDSFIVYFPFGGTETSISVYKSMKSKKAIHEIDYSFGDTEGSYIVFKKPYREKYFINLASCHWTGNIWLLIK
jgi:hypothetical protein